MNKPFLRIIDERSPVNWGQLRKLCARIRTPFKGIQMERHVDWAQPSERSTSPLPSYPALRGLRLADLKLGQSAWADHAALAVDRRDIAWLNLEWPALPVGVTNNIRVTNTPQGFVVDVSYCLTHWHPTYDEISPSAVMVQEVTGRLLSL